MTAKASGNKVAIKWVWIAVAALILVIGALTPDWPGLAFQGKMAILIMVASIVLWATEALPLPVTALGMMGLVPFFGIMTFNETWSSSVNSSIIFLVGVFAFTTFLGNATFPHRLIGKVLQMSKGNSSIVLLGFMIIGAVISTVMSNIALTAILMSIAMTVLDANDCKPGESGLGRAMSLGIPFAVMLGGCLLPSGTPINVLVLGLVESNFGVTVSFLDWFLVAIIPVALSLFATWFILVKAYKPEPIGAEALEASLKQAKELPPMDVKEKINIGIILLTLVLWIMSSWFPMLNTTAVALIALFCMFLPGTSMITIKDYKQSSPWDILLMLMAVNAIVAGMSAQGSAAWIVDTALGGLAGMGFIVLFIIASVMLAALHNFIPAGPALAGLVTIPFVGLAVSTSGNVTAMAIMVAIWAACAFVIPLDSVPLVTYARGYYKFGEMWKGGLPTTIVLLVATCIFLPLMAGVLGLA